MRLIRPSTVPRALAAGAFSGVVATLAMSAVMLLAGRLRIMGTQPPERVVERGAAEAGIPTNEAEQDAAASVAHLAFGAGAGAAFGLIQRMLRASTPELVAVPWALTVWAVSYLGWVPALRILPPATEDQAGRAWTMLAAHIVFGLTLGAAWRMSRPLTRERGAA